MKKYGLLACAALFLFLTGCTEEPTPETRVTPTPGRVQVEITALPTATPVPTPTPLFLPRDDKGNLDINQDLENSLEPTSFPLAADTVILLYHTHGEEAFRQEKGYTYKETGEGTYKTLETDKSILALGRLLQQELEGMGYTVLHDETDCEPPDIYSAYSRSLQVMEKYPQATVFIDLHRNAANVKEKKDDVVLLDGKRCAKMFFVVGTGIGTRPGEYDIAPDWQQNYLLAKSMTEKLREADPELCGDIRLKVGRYNQHMSPYCMLVELGHNANTFADAANTIPYLARAIGEVLPLLPAEDAP